MKKTLLLATALSTLSLSTIAHDGETHNTKNSPRIDDHAPIGVMADHAHKKGEWMAGLRYMSMEMGNPFMTTMGPQEMDMSMIMAGIMYAPADWVTLQIGTRFTNREMDMIMMGNEMEMKAKGFGDTSVNALFPVINTVNERLVLRTGLSLPTGSNNKTNAMGQRLGQMMQPSNGALATTLSATYVYFDEKWSAGGQISATFSAEDNRYDTTPGNKWHTTAWASYSVHESISVSSRLSFEKMSANDNSTTGSRNVTRVHFGANTILRGDFLKGQRIAIEFSAPLSEHKNHHVLKSGNSLMIGLQKAF